MPRHDEPRSLWVLSLDSLGLDVGGLLLLVGAFLPWNMLEFEFKLSSCLRARNYALVAEPEKISCVSLGLLLRNFFLDSILNSFWGPWNLV